MLDLFVCSDWPAESKLAAKIVVRPNGSAYVRQLPDYGATVFASPLAASEDWSLGDPFPFCHLRFKMRRNRTLRR